MSKVTPCLWFFSEAEEAANFYVSLLPESRIVTVQRNNVDSPGGKAGAVLVIEFTLGGQRFMALNGGMRMEYTHAVSFKIDCADQAEVDRLWDALVHEPSQCGWLVDGWGLSWQILPDDLQEIIADPRGMQAMLTMTKLDVAALRRSVGRDR